MSTTSLRRGLTAIAAVALIGSAAIVEAGVFRAYLSSNGGGSACTLQAPCRLLDQALAAVNDGGEIWLLDSANFNTSTVTITKSVTILAVPGALGSVVANNGDAIVINAPAAKVTLRNLVVLNLSGGTPGPTGLNGIVLASGAGLTIEDCEVQGLSGRGIQAFTSGARIAILRTVVRDSGFRGISFSGTLEATLDHVQVLNAPIGVIIGPGLNATISNSVVAGNLDAGNGVGIKAQTNAVATTNLSIENTVVRGGDTGLGVTSDGGSALVNVTRSSLSQNNTGVSAALSAGSAAAVLDNSSVTHNGIAGADTTGGGVIFTRQNNVFQFNNNDVNGALTPLVAK